ncbi:MULTISPECIES: TRAP transporter large permease [Marivita]|jgi:tripartite ATP-independent transporter DctM subunit|uniref:TRAP transporter large permease protein n=1 Tax=Marivita cryptomonadis TaxID=505252 RepID=A0A9Q2NQX1_9RHOB|nr:MULTISPECIES: TRAP transporter large permease [Marivita]MCR9168738.1 TRAP transporter large permease [Paracoccaceae bacterium]MBM2321027.1 TRAP transporter large permease [Marivita cryptomonadis]MBM2330608.1 TRAP transporter large permease [Marivita cryptomonadis]MBM2340194.1 TRAP transporter large permease [Marivita cryptomonadis]MBM2344856.1 TRAP transporter large permease [Marivita cryptomonadis]
MTGLEIGLISVGAIVLLIYSGMHVGIALSLVSFLSVALQKDSLTLAMKLLTLAAADGIADQTFAVIPLFVLMGLIMSASDVGRDAYDVGDYFLRRVRGGLGIATVGSNAVFAAVTGVSIASAAVFTRVAVPEMLRLGYSPRFAVGTVAGSSVLGMLIPPSILLIIYAILTEQSIGMMFFAGIGPGILLSTVYCIGIIGMAYFMPWFVYDQTGRFSDQAAIAESDPRDRHSLFEILLKFLPLMGLVFIVLGGIYGGIFTPTEAGAVGAICALVLAVARKKMSLKAFWKVLLETGHITASICFLIIAATMYSRSLALAGVPTEIGGLVQTATDQFLLVVLIYVLVVLILGTIIDSVSIILIMVPLFLPVMQGFEADPIWFGILTVIAVEVGLLTPPLGIACFVIKGCIEDPRITLGDVFMGAVPFALMMIFVLGLITAWPHLVYINQWI